MILNVRWHRHNQRWELIRRPRRAPRDRIHRMSTELRRFTAERDRAGWNSNDIWPAPHYRRVRANLCCRC